MDGWEQHQCIMKALKTAADTLRVGADECRAKSRKPTWWSRFAVRLMLPGGWDDLDQWEWEDGCITRHVRVYENDCRTGQLLCKLKAMRAA